MGIPRATITSASLLFAGTVLFGAEPAAVSACEFTRDPSRFDRQSVEVEGVVVAEFESFLFADEGCSGSPGVWLTYGGRETTGIAYCCPGEGEGKRRGAPLKIDGLSPGLVTDSSFREFAKQVRKGGRFRVRMRGTFFAGRPAVPGQVEQPGYGHFGQYRLFVVQRVVAFERLRP